MSLLSYFDLSKRTHPHLTKEPVGEDPTIPISEFSAIDSNKIISEKNLAHGHPKEQMKVEADLGMHSHHYQKYETHPKQSGDKSVQPKGSKVDLGQQIIIYIGLVVGVLFSSAAMQLKSGIAVNVNITLSSLVLSLIIALVLLPVVYEKLEVSSESHILVRIGFAVQHGVFWQVLFGSIGKLFGG
ncbi:MAG TPA: hypothetical protein VLX91_01825 [Candidatus Acidoferrales bacterium]|nr:hypothetical protein [Candidatus Acidoferrales bacterium]